MGNAVTSEETHGNAVAGAAAASAVTQPPVDTVSLANSHTTKRWCASLVLLPPPPPPPPP